MTVDCILLGYWRSSSSYRVRICLELKGLPYHQNPVHLLKDGGQQHQPEFVEKSPLHQLPVLVEREGSETRALTQSLAIIEYLEERYPQPPLLPTDPWSRARAREIAEMVNSGIQPLQNLRVLRSLKASGLDARGWAKEIITHGLTGVEARLAETDEGPFAFEGRPGLVEALLVPQVYAARRFEVEMSAFPCIERLDAACAGLEPFKRAHPDQQPDTPPPEERTP